MNLSLKFLCHKAVIVLLKINELNKNFVLTLPTDINWTIRDTYSFETLNVFYSTTFASKRDRGNRCMFSKSINPRPIQTGSITQNVELCSWIERDVCRFLNNRNTNDLCSKSGKMVILLVLYLMYMNTPLEQQRRLYVNSFRIRYVNMCICKSHKSNRKT